MEKTAKGNKRKRSNKIIPKVTGSHRNKPNMKLMAQAYIDFYHKTKHYL